MKMDEIAYYCATHEQAERVKRQFGLHNATWAKDTVTANVSVARDGGLVPWEGINVAELQFNEDFGIQLEIIRYTLGLHWCMFHPAYDIHGIDTFVAHVGIHVGDDDFPAHLDDQQLVQRALTQHHTAFNDRTYEYRIYKLTPGAYVKYIKRIPK